MGKGVNDVTGLKSFSKWLVVLGAVNWGLVALLNYNLVQSLLGSWPGLVRMVYLLVGVSGFWGAYAMLTNTKKKK